MNSLCPLLLMLIGFCAQNGYSQSDSLYKWGWTIHVNGGLNGYHFTQMERNLGNEFPYDDRYSNGGMEIGADGSVLLFKHFVVRGNYFDTRAFRFSGPDVDGVWRVRAGSIGIGYAEISQADQFLLIPSLSYGWGRGTLDLTATGDMEFGDYVFRDDDNATFHQQTHFLDLNMLFGKMIVLRKGDNPFVFTPAVSLGFKYGLNRGDWRTEGAESVVNDVVGGRFYGAYLKFEIGMGVFQM
ncbi:MAG: hypothetical protein AAF570_04915 [Bacteroidota bacterium]